MTTPAAPKPARTRGAFLTLDGPDGGGKSTQLKRLVAWLGEQGYEAVACRDPGGTPLGEQLRAILLDRHATPISLRAEMLLFMTSRAQLVEEVIRPALDAGRIVVCDRFLLANVVYQGYAGGLPVDDLWDVGRVATAGIMPDLSIVLDVPPEVARARIGAPRDRMEDRPDAYRARVREGFLRALESYPTPYVLIDASGSPEAVAERIEREVARVLGESPRS